MRQPARILSILIGVAWLTGVGVAQAQVGLYSDQTAFQAALNESFTLVNLDGPPLDGFAAPYNVEDAGPAAAFSGLGLDFQVFDASIAAGQAFQITEPGRDRLIANGLNNIGGNLVVDLVTPAHGFGVWSNIGDGGLVRAFTGAGLTGTLLGEAPLGSGGFAGIIAGQQIGSVEITCDFDFDLRCGLYDLQHGRRAQGVPMLGVWSSLALLAALLSIVAMALPRLRKA